MWIHGMAKATDEVCSNDSSEKAPGDDEHHEAAQAKEAKQFSKILEIWDLELNDFKGNFSEAISINMLVTIVIGMAPSNGLEKEHMKC